MMLISAATDLSAQAGTRSPMPAWYAPCAAAAAQLRKSVDGPEGQRALDRISGCGEEGDSAIAYSIQRERVSHDRALLQRQNKYLYLVPRGAVLDAVLSVAADRSATTEARVAALLALVDVTHPSRVVTYQAVTGGLDRMGMPVNGCFRARIAGDSGPSQISSADMDRIHQLAQMLFRDKSQPADVRSAAGCVGS